MFIAIFYNCTTKYCTSTFTLIFKNLVDMCSFYSCCFSKKCLISIKFFFTI